MKILRFCAAVEDREFNRERIEGYKRALRDNQILIQDQYIVDDLKGKYL